MRLPDDAALAAAIAFWLIVIFAQRYGTTAHGARYKDFHVPESAGIAASEKPAMILPVGYPDADATVPAVARRKKPPSEILTVLR